ncbi:MAG: hypothetical protein U1E56_01835 [Bauldia sp.]
MKAVLLGGALLGALTATASAADFGRAAVGQAIAPVSGYTSLYIGTTRWDNEDLDSETAHLFGGDSRVSVWVGQSVTLQFDVEAEATSNGFDDCCYDGDHRVHAVGGVHASWRDGASLLGVFAGALGASVLDTGDDAAVMQTFAGLEGQWYLGNLTLYAQAGGTWVTDVDSYGQDLWFLRGVARYFLSANDKVQIEAMYGQGKFTGVGDGDAARAWTWGASYEHRFNGPFSMFVEYAGLHNWNPTSDAYFVREHQVMLGARVNFGAGTLVENDRRGASLDLPKLARLMSWNYWNE